MEIEKAKEALEKQQQLAEKAAARAVLKPPVVETPKISLFGGAKKPVVEKKGKLSMILSLFSLLWYFAHGVVSIFLCMFNSPRCTSCTSCQEGWNYS